MVSIRKARRKVWRWRVYIARQPNVHAYSRGRFRALDALWGAQDAQHHVRQLHSLMRGRPRPHHPHGQH